MQTLEKLKRNKFQTLEQGQLQHCYGGVAQSTNKTETFSVCDNLTGCSTTYKVVTTDNPDGSCTTVTTTVAC